MRACLWGECCYWRSAAQGRSSAHKMQTWDREVVGEIAEFNEEKQGRGYTWSVRQASQGAAESTICIQTGVFMDMSVDLPFLLPSSLFWQIVGRGFLDVEFPKILSRCYGHSVIGPNGLLGAGRGKCPWAAPMERAETHPAGLQNRSHYCRYSFFQGLFPCSIAQKFNLKKNSHFLWPLLHRLMSS